MPGSARWGEKSSFERGGVHGKGSSASADGGAPVLRALGWSIAVVLVGGVLAAFTTPAGPTRTVLRQGTNPAVPLEAGAPGGPEVPAGPAPSQVPSTVMGGPVASAPAASPAAAKAKPPAATRPATTAAAKPAPAAAAPRLQPATGTYPLRISGTSSVGSTSTAVPTSGSLVVESRGGDQQHRTVGVPGNLVLVQRANAAGTDLLSFSLTAGSTTLSFAPPTPLAFVRTQPGSWNWSVQSTDRTVTLNQTATVTGAAPVSVGGAQVPAVTVQRVFNVTGATVSGTVRLTSTVSLVDRLPLVQHQVINVTGKGLGGLVSKTITSDTTATLTSTSPR